MEHDAGFVEGHGVSREDFLRLPPEDQELLRDSWRRIEQLRAGFVDDAECDGASGAARRGRWRRISRFVEWFRICLRHGWLGNHTKINERPVRYRRGEKRLYRVLCERREQGINLPYGPAAHALVLRRTAEIPPWREPVKKKPPGSKP